MTEILSSLNRNGSGIDIKALTQGLVAADIAPRSTALAKRVTQTEASISAIGLVRAQMDRLSSTAAALGQTPFLTARLQGDAAQSEVTDAAAVREGTTELFVGALARRQVIEFKGFTSATAQLGAGSLVVETGAWTDVANDAFAADPAKPARTLSIAAGATLEEIATQLGTIPGVTARVLDKGDGTFSLGIVSEVGEKSALRLSVQEDPAQPGLAALDMTQGAAEHQVQAASDALLEIDGFFVTRATNQISDLIPGVTLTLDKPGATTVTIARDREVAAQALTALAEEVNATLGLLQQQTARGANGGQRGALAGDLAAEGLITRLRGMMAQPIGGFGASAVTLAELGLTTRRDGSFAFDRAQFDRVFDRDPALLDAAFSDRLFSDTPGVTLSGTPPAQAAFGSHAFLRPGGTGSATIGGGFAIGVDLGDGTSQFVAFGGDLAGVTVTARNGIETATLRHAFSFATLLMRGVEEWTGTSAPLAARETKLAQTLVEQTAEKEALAARTSALEARYSRQFTAMEIAVTQLKGTGQFLTNLIEQWNNAGQS